MNWKGAVIGWVIGMLAATVLALVLTVALDLTATGARIVGYTCGLAGSVSGFLIGLTYGRD